MDYRLSSFTLHKHPPSHGLDFSVRLLQGWHCLREMFTDGHLERTRRNALIPLQGASECVLLRFGGECLREVPEVAGSAAACRSIPSAIYVRLAGCAGCCIPLADAAAVRLPELLDCANFRPACETSTEC